MHIQRILFLVLSIGAHSEKSCGNAAFGSIAIYANNTDKSDKGDPSAKIRMG